jgi:pimeloyl-ACP methyl ester carboxylesterase
VHGLNANQNNFTGPADACLADYLSGRGYDCWTVDLRGTRSSRPPFAQGTNTVTVEDFVWRDLPAAISHIQKATGRGKIHYVGHSLGGLLLYAYVQAHGADKIASGTALGAPTRFSDVMPALPKFLVKAVLRFPWLSGEMLRCVLPFAKLAGKGISAFPINPNNLAPGMGLSDIYPILDDPAPLVHAQVFGWAERGEVTLRQDSLNLTRGYAEMKFPLLAVYGPDDPFVLLDVGKTFFAGIRHDDKKMIVCSRENGCGEDYNHCDLSFGREGAREVFEPIVQWIRAHPCPEAVREAAKPAEMKVAAVAKAVMNAKAPAPARETVAAIPAAAVKQAVVATAPEAAKDAAAAKPAAAVKQAAAATAPEAAKEAAAVEPAVVAKPTAVAQKPESAKDPVAVKAATMPKKAAAKPATALTNGVPAKVPAAKKAATVKKPAAAKEAAAAKPAVAAKKKPAADKKTAPAATAKPAPRKAAAKDTGTKE